MNTGPCPQCWHFGRDATRVRHCLPCQDASRQDWELDGRGRARVAAAAADAAAGDESPPAEDGAAQPQQSAAAPRRVLGLQSSSRLCWPRVLLYGSHPSIIPPMDPRS